ncbi:AraC family transcriptional regulator [Pontibacillus salicampi]|uniref:AraC family transcriptional regulator n=1 Tax=Pontibacillus salicampi TaxID=1449801 RepID=A0ABV6LRW7_9BACI
MSTSIKQSMIDSFMQIRINNRESEYLHPSYLLEKQLLTSVSEGDADKALTILKSMNKEYRPQLAEKPIRSLKNSLISSCTLFTRAVIKGGVQPEQAFHLQDACVLEIERVQDYETLEQMEYEILRHFVHLLHEQQQTPYSKIVNQAIAYIHEHILKDLTLDMIAENSYVSPSYLSHLFKKEVGVSIVQFINQKRIDESKHFLLHTNNSISEIATLFCFCNQSYFTSLFKKYVGITPKEFREQHA